MSKPKTRTLGAVLYEDFELLDLYGPLEMFGSLGAELRIVTVAEKTGPVASFQRPKTVAEFDFASAPMLDLILLPGGFGTIQQLENPAMLDFLRRRAATAEVTMSVCSGSAILAKAGLLDGRRATSNKQFFDLARAQGAAVKWVEQRAGWRMGRSRLLRASRPARTWRSPSSPSSTARRSRSRSPSRRSTNGSRTRRGIRS